ncbi:MAG: GNAT family N-acetyltransferase [Oscillospiraceae bacterium]|nr:GNAT family N-acetyltransferase [Oscillospiraceae bacterium]MBR4192941.1 GNAT family N-acetyltransferase [Oscillospiraceae bacterium]
MQLRFAVLEDLPAVNVLRRQVNELHVTGRPETFKAGFPPELEHHVYTVFHDPDQKILVAEEDGQLCGFAVLHQIRRPETPFMYERRFLDVDEFGVAPAFRRRGVGRALIDRAKAWAKEQGFDRLELNMWEFNRDALAFYEAVGFQTYRRYLEIPL